MEDDPTAREYIHRGLQEHGYQVDLAPDGATGARRALERGYDLIILDVNLPQGDGFDVLRSIRRASIDTPVLFLSARDAVNDRVQGLNLGGDDYLTKPFAFLELLARVQALTRRRLTPRVDGVLHVADLELDPVRHIARRDGREVELTSRESALLEYLIEHAGQVVSRAMIIDQVWGAGFDAYSNVIDVHINHLRKKVDPQRSLIHTVKGVGYVLEERS